MSNPRDGQGYLIEPTDYALVIKADGEVKMYIPPSEPPEQITPRQALALIVIANKLCDDDWVGSLLDEEYFEDAVLME